MTPAFRNLLNRYALLAFERELTFFDWLDDRDVVPVLADGTAKVGAHTFPLHLLGSQAEETKTWRWAWASEAPGVAKAAIATAKKVRQVGKKRAIAELAEEEFPLEPLELDAHTLALVATGVADLPCYEVFPYRGGSLFAALDVPELRVLPAPSPDRVADLLRRVCTRLAVDPRIACPTYLAARGLQLEPTKHGLVTRVSGRELSITFGEGDTVVVELEGRPAGSSGTAGDQPGR